MADPIEISMGRYYALRNKNMQEEKMRMEEAKTPARSSMLMDPFDSPEFDFSPPTQLRGNFNRKTPKSIRSSSSFVSYKISSPLRVSSMSNITIEEKLPVEINTKALSQVSNVENRENEENSSNQRVEEPFSAKKKCGTRQIPTSVKKGVHPSKIPTGSSIRTPRKKGKKMASKSPAINAMKRASLQKVMGSADRRNNGKGFVKEKISHIPLSESDLYIAPPSLISPVKFESITSPPSASFTPSSRSLQTILIETPINVKEEYEETKEELKDSELSPIFAECGISPPKTPMFRSSQKNRLLAVINTPIVNLEDGMKSLKLIEKEMMLLTPDILPFSPPQAFTADGKKKHQPRFPLDDDSFTAISPPKSVVIKRSKDSFTTPATTTILPSILSLDSSPEISPNLMARYTRTAPTPAVHLRQVKEEEEEVEQFDIKVGRSMVDIPEEYQDDMEEDVTALFSKSKLQESKKLNQIKEVKEENKTETIESLPSEEISKEEEEEVTALYSRSNLVMAPKYLLQKKTRTPMKTPNRFLDEGEDFEDVEKTIELDNSIFHGRRTPRSSKFRNQAIKPSCIPRPFKMSAKKSSTKKKLLIKPRSQEESTDSPLITRINIVPVSRSNTIKIAKTPSPDKSSSSDIFETARTLNFSLQPSQKNNVFVKMMKR